MGESPLIRKFSRLPKFFHYQSDKTMFRTVLPVLALSSLFAGAAAAGVKLKQPCSKCDKTHFLSKNRRAELVCPLLGRKPVGECNFCYCNLNIRNNLRLPNYIGKEIEIPRNSGSSMTF